MDDMRIGGSNGHEPECSLAGSRQPFTPAVGQTEPSVFVEFCCCPAARRAFARGYVAGEKGLLP